MKYPAKRAARETTASYGLNVSFSIRSNAHRHTGRMMTPPFYAADTGENLSPEVN
jgi:hypothetical protein